jgi:hypothetical protein
MAGANRFSPPGNDKSLGQLAEVIDDLNPLAIYAADTAAFVQVSAGSFRRLAPRASGMQVVLPEAVGENFGTFVTLTIENALGVCRVRATSGTINGTTALTLAAGYNGLVELVSNGSGNWAVSRGGAANWRDVLAQGVNSGPYNPLIDAGQYLQFGSAAVPATGEIRSGSSLEINVTGNVQVTASGDFLVDTGDDIIFNAATAGASSISMTSGFVFNLTSGTGAMTLSVPNASLRVLTGGVERLEIESNGEWQVGNASGSLGEAIVHQGANVTPLWARPYGVLLRAPQYLTAGTSINHPAGTRVIFIRGVAGGGGGGGCAAGAGSAGACGGSGTYGEATIVVNSLTSTYAIGAAGTGVSAAAGNNGGNSTFVNDVTIVTLPGGAGGALLAAGSGVAHAFGGVGGGAATGADFSVPGQRGGHVLRITGNAPMAQGSGGGSTPVGNGGGGNVTSGIAVGGEAATGYGGGGAGRMNGTAGGAGAGGTGTQGLWIVEEYA